MGQGGFWNTNSPELIQLYYSKVLKQAFCARVWITFRKIAETLNFLLARQLWTAAESLTLVWHENCTGGCWGWILNILHLTNGHSCGFARQWGKLVLLGSTFAMSYPPQSPISRSQGSPEPLANQITYPDPSSGEFGSGRDQLLGPIATIGYAKGFQLAVRVCIPKAGLPRCALIRICDWRRMRYRPNSQHKTSQTLTVGRNVSLRLAGCSLRVNLRPGYTLGINKLAVNSMESTSFFSDHLDRACIPNTTAFKPAGTAVPA